MNARDFDKLFPCQPYVIAMARRELPGLVTDIAQLEGVNITVPEVSTLLDGVTVGGHKLSDQQMILNQATAWHQMLSDIEDGKFELSKDYMCSLHALVAKDEALVWGEFRTGQVTIAGTDYLPPAADSLGLWWDDALANFKGVSSHFKRAVGLFGDIARSQFFFDGNKRTGRMMMSGYLLSEGLPMLNVKHVDQLEFNQAMLSFYQSGSKSELITFFETYCINHAIASQLQDKQFVDDLNMRYKVLRFAKDGSDRAPGSSTTQSMSPE